MLLNSRNAYVQQMRDKQVDYSSRISVITQKENNQPSQIMMSVLKQLVKVAHNQTQTGGSSLLLKPSIVVK